LLFMGGPGSAGPQPKVRWAVEAAQERGPPRVAACLRIEFEGAMRILGLDMGSRRIGVAVSDPMGWTAQGLPTLEPRGEQQLIAEIQRLVAQLEVERVVVGLPRNMDGTIGSQARKVLAFVEKLRAALGLPVDTWDERLTTVAAHKSMSLGGLSRARRKGAVDRVAAQLILQGYLDSLRLPVPP
jgi:putative Holliday junction resolvase